jgi:hypothetical protein
MAAEATVAAAAATPAVRGAGLPPMAAAAPELFESPALIERDGGAPSPPVAGAELWQRTVVELQARKPIQGAYAAQGVFLDRSGSELIVGFATSSQMARDALNRPTAKSAVEEILAALSGEALGLRLEMRADLPAPTPPPRPEPETSAQKPKPETEATPKPSDVSQPVATDFFSDPLIAEALELFEAKIVSLQPAVEAKAGK